MPTYNDQIEANEQNIRKVQIALLNILRLSQQKSDEVRVITNGITNEAPLISELVEKAASVFVLAEELNKVRGYLIGMIKEVDEADEIEQDRLAKIVTSVDPEVAAKTPGALQSLLYLAGGEIMRAAFGPNSWLPPDKRLMMLNELNDLVELQKNKIEAENGN